MKYEKFIDEKCHNGECIRFFANSYTDWKNKEAEIKEEFPEASCVSMPGLGYTGEYWYKI